LLIVDYQLADGLLGTTVAQQLKSQAGFADLPVLMITANSQQQLAIELKQQGYQLLYKPVRPLQLKSMLRHLLLGV
jgi:CheY-like chemotaxis protein